MNLFQLPVRILFALFWILLATESVRSQSNNMSDITLPSTDAMISEPDSSGENGASTEDVTTEDTDTATDQATTEETDTATDQVTAEETDTTTDEVTAEETDTTTDEVTAEDTDTATEETDTDTDQVTAEETDTTNDEVTAEDTAPDDGEVTAEQIEEDTDTFNDLGEDTAGSIVDENNAALDVAEEAPNTDLESSTQNGAVEQENAGSSDSSLEETEASDVVETSDTESEIAESEPAASDQEDISDSTDTEVIEETTEAENSVESNEAESNEIVEELLEEAELREIKNSQETEEVVQEETSQEDTEEISEQEATEEAVAQEETEEVTQDETTEEEVAQEETEEVTQDDTTEEDVAEKEVTDEEEEVAEEEVTDEEEVAEEEATDEEDEVAEEQNSESEIGQLDRAAYETQFQEAPNDLAILMQEEFQLTQLIDSSGIKLYGSVPSVKEISRRLAQLAEQTGKKPAFINISLQSNQLESFVVLPEQTQADANNSVVASSELNTLDAPQTDALSLRKTVKDTSRKDVIATATNFREEISDIRKLNQEEYKASAQELYNILIKPIEAELEANDIDVLVFSMDSGLRLLPVAALHDGEQFLIEKYAMGIVPSFGLTDTRYVSPESSTILAMGASEFEEQISLPTMPLELQTIVSTPRRGESFLNEQFTIPNFVAQNSRETPFSIIHLGTHAEFKAGNLGDSYIQFYDDKLNIPQLQRLSEDLGWNSDATPVELLVLSACETALGNKEAELGFAGLAVQAGVKSALASLWYVSDLGTLALMGEFYDQLGNTLIKAEALRQTQLEMLHGNVKVDNQEVKLSNGEGLALSEDFPKGTLTLDHPYFWSSFTLIGNWN